MLAAAPQAKNICWSLPLGQVCSPWAGLLPRGWHSEARRTLLMARCSSALLPFPHGALGCCHYFSESPKEDALSRVSVAKCALEFNSCYSAVITHFMEYLVTVARASLIRFGLLLLLYFKDLSAKHFLSALKIVCFSVFSLRR